MLLIIVLLFTGPPSKAKGKFIKLIEALIHHDEMLPFHNDFHNMIERIVLKSILNFNSHKSLTGEELVPPTHSPPIQLTHAQV